MDIRNLINVEDKLQSTAETTFDSSSSGASSLVSSPSEQNSSSPRSSPKLLDKIQGSPKVLNTIMKTKKKGIYKCSHCSTHFPNFIALAKHYDEFNIKRDFFCPMEDCPWHVIGLPNKNELNRHIKSQHQPRQFVCRLGCDYKFHRADTRNRHEKQVHLNKNSRLNKSQRSKRMKKDNNDNNDDNINSIINNNDNDNYNNDNEDAILKMRSFSTELPNSHHQQYIEQDLNIRRTASLPVLPVLQLPFTYIYPLLTIPPVQQESLHYALHPPVRFHHQPQPPPLAHINHHHHSNNNNSNSNNNSNQNQLPDLLHFYYGTNFRAT